MIDNTRSVESAESAPVPDHSHDGRQTHDRHGAGQEKS